MGRRGYAEVKPWMLFAFPLAIATPIIAAIALGGPMLGFPVAALVAIVIVGVAIRMRPAGERGKGEPAGWRPGAATAWRFAAAAVVVIAGSVVFVATGGTVRIIGLGMVALGLTLALSLVFLEVGYSEDRVRREDRRRGPRPHGT
jgi:hypothetical protein